jgi:cob(I)alamin adenosyltransferase
VRWKNIVRNDGTGHIHILCGDGKGKTTSAVGQTVRAAGYGFTVFFVRFLKPDSPHGEALTLNGLSGVVIRSFGSGRFLTRDSITDDDRRLAEEGISFVEDTAAGHRADMIVLDEIGAALELGLVDEDKLIRVFDLGKDWLDIVLTGRSFAERVIGRADLITEMINVRHPFDSGALSRKGIEY